MKKYTPSITFFNSILDDMFDYPTSSSNKPLVKKPNYDIIENEKEYQIELLLAGIKKENININVEKDVLTIKAERKEINDINFNRKETYYGKYEKSFMLPDDIDNENIKASLIDGILTVGIPKIEKDIKSGKKTIEIM